MILIYIESSFKSKKRKLYAKETYAEGMIQPAVAKWPTTQEKTARS